MVATTIVAVCFIIFFIVTVRNLRKLKGAYRALYHKSLETLSSNVETGENGDKQSPEAPQAEHTESKKGMDAEQMTDLKARIDEVLANTSEICSVDFSLNRLAELVGQKYWNMSAIIKMIYSKNFNTLLNEYRFKEACRRMNDVAKYGNYTIEAISASVGFKSRSNFVLTFKNMTGLTPSAYQKLAKQEKK